MLATLLFVLAPGVWTIDDNGPADFADLPEAVAAVSDGDILRLMPGSYTGTTIDKNLTLIGIEGGFFEYVAINQPGLVVDGSLGGPSTLTLKDMYVFGLVLTNLSKRVRIERANLFNVLVEDCPDVVFVGTGVQQSGFAPPALTVHNSSLHLIGSGVLGGQNLSSYNGSPALVLLDDCEVHLSGSTIQGGNGVTHVLDNGIGGPAIAVVAGASNLVIRGSSTDVIQGGHKSYSPLPPSQTQVPSIVYQGGTLGIHWSGITFDDAPVAAVVPAEPYLVNESIVDPASPVHSFSAFGALGDIAVVVACAPSNTNTPTAFLGDNLRVDLNRMLLYRVLVLNGQDTPSTVALTAPTGPAFVGVKVDLQALVARADGSFFVTNSTHVILKQ